jgi:anti-sigma factor RsiW
VTCEEIRELLSPYADVELDLVRALEVERHLDDCPACAARLEDMRALSSRLADPALYHQMPSRLKGRVRAALRPPWQLAWPGLVAAAAAVLVAIGLWAALSALASPVGQEMVARDVVAGHVRSLMVNHLVDVESSDRHTVKPWFTGKLDFAPEVKDLTANGFPLVGGRLDYIDGRPAAAIVYRRDRHTINVFVWRTSDRDSAPQALERQGYHLLHWTEGGRTFWAVSDLNETELRELAELLR